MGPSDMMENLRSLPRCDVPDNFPLTHLHDPLADFGGLFLVMDHIQEREINLPMQTLGGKTPSEFCRGEAMRERTA